MRGPFTYSTIYQNMFNKQNAKRRRKTTKKSDSFNLKIASSKLVGLFTFKHSILYISIFRQTNCVNDTRITRRRKKLKENETKRNKDRKLNIFIPLNLNSRLVWSKRNMTKKNRNKNMPKNIINHIYQFLSSFLSLLGQSIDHYYLDYYCYLLIFSHFIYGPQPILVCTKTSNSKRKKKQQQQQQNNKE